MKLAVLYTYGPYLNNEIFNKENKQINHNDVLSFFHILKEELYEKGIKLTTQDITPLEDASIVIFNDMPKKIPKKTSKQVFWLLATESIAVMPKNFDKKLHQQFDKVFTWKDDIIDNKKYFKLNYSFLLSPKDFLPFNQKKGFLCLINNNKYYNYKNQLYSKRVEFINWFEKYHYENFDLYGMGWQNKQVSPLLYKVVNKLKLNSLIERKPPLKVFKGSTNDKYSVIREYKFNICFENCYGVPGYITEKIFDCFLNGTIPVYLGAPNIKDHIPSHCFIDYTKFKGIDELYQYLKNLSENDYHEFQKKMKDFLSSSKGKKFDNKYNARIVTSFAN